MSTSKQVQKDDDAAQLRALGYESNFDRSMSKWENFSLGFTYLSPVVGVYTVFAFALAAGGPPMFWNYLIVGACQLLVCLVFGEVVSQFPISGGLYPWARRLVGKRWAWMAGWVYACALCTTISAVATGGAPFVAQLIGIEVGPVANTSVALAMILATTLLNLSGTRLLARVAMFGFICELIGALVVGGYLLLFARHQAFAVLFDTFHLQVEGSYLWAFAASALGAMFCYYGFEACGDVAEETPDRARHDPQGDAHDHLCRRRIGDVRVPGPHPRGAGPAGGAVGAGQGSGRPRPCARQWATGAFAPSSPSYWCRSSRAC